MTHLDEIKEELVKQRIKKLSEYPRDFDLPLEHEDHEE